MGRLMGKLISWAVTILLCTYGSTLSAADTGNTTNATHTDYPFNKAYKPDDMGVPLSWINTEAALSGVALHRGLVFAPLGYDHGGGMGLGAFALYNIDDPANPVSVFDSRDYPQLYHLEGGEHYVGDFAEAHAIAFSGDLVLMSERRPNSAGFSILDLGPLFDDDPESKPRIVSRFSYPGVGIPTNYEGYSFSPAWAGGRYVYAPTGSHGLYIIDTQDLRAPFLVAHLPKSQLYNQAVHSAVALGDLLILSPTAVAVNNEYVVFVDVSNPAQPKLINKHLVSIGYQGFVYGSKFYGGGTRVENQPSKLISYDFSDPENISEQLLAETTLLKKPEYGFLKDDDLFIGHYPGLIKWKIDNNKASVATVMEPQHPPADDYAFVTPVGNLVVVTSDHNVESRMNIGVHDMAPDTRGPELRYALPKMGQNHVQRNTTIGFSFSDFIDPLSLSEQTLSLRKTGSTQAVSCGYSHLAGIVNIVPHHPLDANSSYEVLVTGMMTDQVGNPYVGERLLTRFSTGEQIEDYNLQIKTDEPAVIGKTVTLSAEVLNSKGEQTFEFAWDLGDPKEPLTTFTTQATLSHRFANAGNHVITLHARLLGEKKESKVSAVQVIHNPLPAHKPSSSSTLAYDHSRQRVYVVNPDNDTLTAIDASSLEKRYEVPVGNNPVSVALLDDQLWVSNKGSDTIMVLRADDGALLKTLPLPYASAPHGLITVAARQRVYVALSASGDLLELDSKNYTLQRTLPLGGTLRELAYVPNQDQLLLPHFIAQGQRGGKLSIVDRAAWREIKTLALQASLNPDGLSNGRGQPNYLAALAVNPDQSSAWIPGKKDNLFRGNIRNGEPLTFDHTVRSMAARIDLSTGTESFERRIDIDNNDFTTAAAFSHHGNRLFLSALGSSTILAVDSYNEGNRVSFDSAGLAPIGMVLNEDGSRLFVHNFMSRSVSVFDISSKDYSRHLASIKTVANEKLTADVLAGKSLFFDSRSPQLSQEGYMSCASCHMDGAHDGRVWDLSNMGEGLRNTIDLRGKAGTEHGPLHWSANFDEVQDFEIQIRKLTQGLGLIDEKHYSAHMGIVQPAYGNKKSGLSTSLDNLAAYVSSLNEYPKSPYRPSASSMTASAKAGRQHFIQLDCHRCHRGDEYTDSTIGRIHDVGTLSANSGMHLNGPLLGLDTPSLVGLWQSAPYFHDGSAATLSEVFNARTNARTTEGLHHSLTKELAATEKTELMAFLMQLESGEGIAAKETGSHNKPPQFTKPSYTFKSPHDANRKKPIGRVQARDPDQQQRLSYYLKTGEDAGLFSVDKNSGDIYYHGEDLYQRQNYQFQLMVEDDGDFIQQASAPVKLSICQPRWWAVWEACW